MLPLCWTLLLVVSGPTSVATSTSYYATRDMCEAAGKSAAQTFDGSWRSQLITARFVCALANSPTPAPTQPN